MNITVNSQRLAAELRSLNKVVPSKPTITVLSHALVTAADDGISLYATDLEVSLMIACPAKVHAPGTIVVPAARLLAIVEQFDDGDVSISFEKKQVIVKHGAFRSQLQAMSSIDFPTIPTVGGPMTMLGGDALKRLIGQTRYAINASSSKYVLQGALLTVIDQGALLVATDGKRLAIAAMTSSGAPCRIIIPSKSMDLLASQIEGGDVEMSIGENHLFFNVGDKTIISRMIAGEYPKYEGIIPRANDKVATVDRHATSAALKRVKLVSEDTQAVYLSFSEGVLSLTSSSAEVGASEESLKIGYDGPPIRLAVKGDYLVDFLDAAIGSTVTIALEDATSPLLLTDGKDHISVVMVMR